MMTFMEGQSRLTATAKKLATLNFVHPLEPAEWAEKTVKRRFSELPHFGCHRLVAKGDYVTWRLMLSLGGGRRTLGILSSYSLGLAPKMFRFADMAKLYFWRYKARRRIEPTDETLNLSLRTARLDLERETAMVALLKELEVIMLDSKMIMPLSEEPPPVRRSASLASQLPGLLAALSSFQERTGESLSHLESNSSRLGERLTTFSAHLDKLAAAVRDLERAVKVMRDENLKAHTVLLGGHADPYHSFKQPSIAPPLTPEPPPTPPMPPTHEHDSQKIKF